MSDLQIHNDPQASLVNEKWYKDWRMLAAYVFLAICLWDFMFAQISFDIIGIVNKTAPTVWTPQTMGANGLFYMSFMVILGISAWGRTNAITEAVKNMPDYSNVVANSLPDSSNPPARTN